MVVFEKVCLPTRLRRKRGEYEKEKSNEVVSTSVQEKSTTQMLIHDDEEVSYDDNYKEEKTFLWTSSNNDELHLENHHYDHRWSEVLKLNKCREAQDIRWRRRRRRRREDSLVVFSEPEEEASKLSYFTNTNQGEEEEEGEESRTKIRSSKSKAAIPVLPIKIREEDDEYNQRDERKTRLVRGTRISVAKQRRSMMMMMRDFSDKRGYLVRVFFLALTASLLVLFTLPGLSNQQQLAGLESGGEHDLLRQLLQSTGSVEEANQLLEVLIGRIASSAQAIPIEPKPTADYTQVRASSGEAANTALPAQQPELNQGSSTEAPPVRVFLPAALSNSELTLVKPGAETLEKKHKGLLDEIIEASAKGGGGAWLHANQQVHYDDESQSQSQSPASMLAARQPLEAERAIALLRAGKQIENLLSPPTAASLLLSSSSSSSSSSIPDASGATESGHGGGGSPGGDKDGLSNNESISSLMIRSGNPQFPRKLIANYSHWIIHERAVPLEPRPVRWRMNQQQQRHPDAIRLINAPSLAANQLVAKPSNPQALSSSGSLTLTSTSAAPGSLTSDPVSLLLPVSSNRSGQQVHVNQAARVHMNNSHEKQDEDVGSNAPVAVHKVVFINSIPSWSANKTSSSGQFRPNQPEELLTQQVARIEAIETSTSLPSVDLNVFAEPLASTSLPAPTTMTTTTTLTPSTLSSPENSTQFYVMETLKDESAGKSSTANLSSATTNQFAGNLNGSSRGRGKSLAKKKKVSKRKQNERGKQNKAPSRVKVATKATLATFEGSVTKMPKSVSSINNNNNNNLELEKPTVIPWFAQQPSSLFLDVNGATAKMTTIGTTTALPIITSSSESKSREKNKMERTRDDYEESSLPARHEGRISPIIWSMPAQDAAAASAPLADAAPSEAVSKEEGGTAESTGTGEPAATSATLEVSSTQTGAGTGTEASSGISSGSSNSGDEHTVLPAASSTSNESHGDGKVSASLGEQQEQPERPEQAEYYGGNKLVAGSTRSSSLQIDEDEGHRQGVIVELNRVTSSSGGSASIMGNNNSKERRQQQVVGEAGQEQSSETIRRSTVSSSLLPNLPSTDAFPASTAAAASFPTATSSAELETADFSGSQVMLANANLNANLNANGNSNSFASSASYSNEPLGLQLQPTTPGNFFQQPLARHQQQQQRLAAAAALPRTTSRPSANSTSGRANSSLLTTSQPGHDHHSKKTSPHLMALERQQQQVLLLRSTSLIDQLPTSSLSEGDLENKTRALPSQPYGKRLLDQQLPQRTGSLVPGSHLDIANLNLTRVKLNSPTHKRQQQQEEEAANTRDWLTGTDEHRAQASSPGKQPHQFENVDADDNDANSRAAERQSSGKNNNQAKHESITINTNLPNTANDDANTGRSLQEHQDKLLSDLIRPAAHLRPLEKPVQVHKLPSKQPHQPESYSHFPPTTFSHPPLTATTTTSQPQQVVQSIWLSNSLKSDLTTILPNRDQFDSTTPFSSLSTENSAYPSAPSSPYMLEVLSAPSSTTELPREAPESDLFRENLSAIFQYKLANRSSTERPFHGFDKQVENSSYAAGKLITLSSSANLNLAHKNFEQEKLVALKKQQREKNLRDYKRIVDLSSTSAVRSSLASPSFTLNRGLNSMSIQSSSSSPVVLPSPTSSSSERKRAFQRLQSSSSSSSMKMNNTNRSLARRDKHKTSSVNNDDNNNNNNTSYKRHNNRNPNGFQEQKILLASKSGHQATMDDYEHDGRQQQFHNNNNNNLSTTRETPLNLNNNNEANDAYRLNGQHNFQAASDGSTGSTGSIGSDAKDKDEDEDKENKERKRSRGRSVNSIVGELRVRSGNESSGKQASSMKKAEGEEIEAKLSLLKGSHLNDQSIGSWVASSSPVPLQGSFTTTRPLEASKTSSPVSVVSLTLDDDAREADSPFGSAKVKLANNQIFSRTNSPFNGSFTRIQEGEGEAASNSSESIHFHHHSLSTSPSPSSLMFNGKSIYVKQVASSSSTSRDGAESTFSSSNSPATAAASTTEASNQRTWQQRKRRREPPGLPPIDLARVGELVTASASAQSLLSLTTTGKPVAASSTQPSAAQKVTINLANLFKRLPSSLLAESSGAEEPLNSSKVQPTMAAEQYTGKRETGNEPSGGGEGGGALNSKIVSWLAHEARAVSNLNSGSPSGVSPSSGETPINDPSDMLVNASQFEQQQQQQSSLSPLVDELRANSLVKTMINLGVPGGSGGLVVERQQQQQQQVSRGPLKKRTQQQVRFVRLDKQAEFTGKQVTSTNSPSTSSMMMPVEFPSMNPSQVPEFFHQQQQESNQKSDTSVTRASLASSSSSSSSSSGRGALPESLLVRSRWRSSGAEQFQQTPLFFEKPLVVKSVGKATSEASNFPEKLHNLNGSTRKKQQMHTEKMMISSSSNNNNNNTELSIPQSRNSPSHSPSSPGQVQPSGSEVMNHDASSSSGSGAGAEAGESASFKGNNNISPARNGPVELVETSISGKAAKGEADEQSAGIGASNSNSSPDGDASPSHTFGQYAAWPKMIAPSESVRPVSGNVHHLMSTKRTVNLPAQDKLPSSSTFPTLDSEEHNSASERNLFLKSLSSVGQRITTTALSTESPSASTKVFYDDTEQSANTESAVELPAAPNSLNQTFSGDNQVNLSSEYRPPLSLGKVSFPVLQLSSSLKTNSSVNADEHTSLSDAAASSNRLNGNLTFLQQQQHNIRLTNQQQASKSKLSSAQKIAVLTIGACSGLLVITLLLVAFAIKCCGCAQSKQSKNGASSGVLYSPERLTSSRQSKLRDRRARRTGRDKRGRESLVEGVSKRNGRNHVINSSRLSRNLSKSKLLLLETEGLLQTGGADINHAATSSSLGGAGSSSSLCLSSSSENFFLVNLKDDKRRVFSTDSSPPGPDGRSKRKCRQNLNPKNRTRRSGSQSRLRATRRRPSYEKQQSMATDRQQLQYATSAKSSIPQALPSGSGSGSGANATLSSLNQSATRRRAEGGEHLQQSMRRDDERRATKNSHGSNSNNRETLRNRISGTLTSRLLRMHLPRLLPYFALHYSNATPSGCSSTSSSAEQQLLDPPSERHPTGQVKTSRNNNNKQFTIADLLGISSNSGAQAATPKQSAAADLLLSPSNRSHQVPNLSSQQQNFHLKASAASTAKYLLKSPLSATLSPTREGSTLVVPSTKDAAAAAESSRVVKPAKKAGKLCHCSNCSANTSIGPGNWLSNSSTSHHQHADSSSTCLVNKHPLTAQTAHHAPASSYNSKVKLLFGAASTILNQDLHASVQATALPPNGPAGNSRAFRRHPIPNQASRPNAYTRTGQLDTEITDNVSMQHSQVDNEHHLLIDSEENSSSTQQAYLQSNNLLRPAQSMDNFYDIRRQQTPAKVVTPLSRNKREENQSPNLNGDNINILNSRSQVSRRVIPKTQQHLKLIPSRFNQLAGTGSVAAAAGNMTSHNQHHHHHLPLHHAYDENEEDIEQDKELDVDSDLDNNYHNINDHDDYDTQTTYQIQDTADVKHHRQQQPLNQRTISGSVNTTSNANNHLPENNIEQTYSHYHHVRQNDKQQTNSNCNCNLVMYPL